MITATHYIAFPALGWEFPLNDVLAQFTLFGHEFTIKWYGVLIAIGFLLAVIYGLRRAPELGINPDKMIDAVLVCTLAAFVCARLYYVFFCDDVHSYLQDPLSILYIWEGGIGIYGGIIGAFASGLLMCRLCKLPTLTMFDLTSLGFLIGQSIGRWGNFFNQEAFGGNTTLPWGMTGDIIRSGVNGSDYITSQPVHPTFLYESLWCLLGFLILHILSKKLYKFPGQIFCGYLVWYGCGRFLIESLRTDSLMMGNIRASQLVAIVTVIGGIILFFVFRRHAHSLPKTLAAEEPDSLDIPPEAAETAPAVFLDNTAAAVEEENTAQAVQKEDTHGNDH